MEPHVDAIIRRIRYRCDTAAAVVTRSYARKNKKESKGEKERERKRNKERRKKLA